MRLLVTSGIYCIHCLSNGWRYVGASIHAEARMYTHYRHLARNTHSCKELQRDWNAYGIDYFDWSILTVTDDLTQEKAVAEQYKPNVYSSGRHKIPQRVKDSSLARPAVSVSFPGHEFSSLTQMSFAMGKCSIFVAKKRRLHPEMTLEDIWKKYMGDK